MPTLSPTRLQTLLAPYVGDFPTPATLYDQLTIYLDLLLRWNARTNLTAIRDPEEIVRRHFGESLFAATHLAPRVSPLASLLDFGSGAGFPGLPIQLLLPTLRVTLAESQNKKATFLREVVRTLALPTQIHAARVETLPPATKFDTITLRAVDNMPAALAAAAPHLAHHGWLVLLSGEPAAPPAETFPIPNTTNSFLTLQQR